MTDQNRLRGRLGEDVAALLLASRGYRVIDRNVRAGRSEIDLLVERGETLILVEVKWRRGDFDPAPAAGAWSRGQRQRARDAAARLMLAIPGASGRPWRFDLVTIVEAPRGWRIEHHAGAWSPGDSFW
jgi:putative endonuclease